MTDNRKTESQLPSELKTLPESHQLYLSIFQNASEGILVADIESRRFLQMNPAICKMLGYSREELQQMSVADIHPAEVLDHVVSEFDALARQDISLASDIPCVRADGTEIYVDVSAAQVIEDGRPCLVVFFTDITERRRAEEITANERKLRSLINNIPSVTWTSDDAGTITFISSSIESVYGYTPEEMYRAGARLRFDRIHEDDIDRVKVAYSELLKQDGHYDIEYRIRKKNGDWIWLYDRVIRTYDDHGAMRVDGVFFDITERKLAEEKLEASEKRFQDVAMCSGDWVWEVDVCGTYTFASGTVKKILGYEPSELIGKAPFETMPEDEAKRIGELFGQIVSERRPIVDLENWNLTKDGRRVCLLTNGVPIFDENKDLVGYRGVDKDITERKQAEEELLGEKLLSEEYINSMPGLFYVFDEERFVKWNKAWNRITGYNDEELAGMYGTDFFEGEDKTHIGERMLKTFTEGASEAEAELITKDGRRIPCYFTGQRKRLNGKDHLVGLGIDITERKRAEAALRVSEEKYKCLFESAGEALFIMSVSEEQGIRFADCNDNTMRLFGCTERDQIIGKHPEAFSPQTQPDGVRSSTRVRELGEAVMAGHPQTFEWEHLRLDGTPLLVEVNLNRIEINSEYFIQAVVRDITARTEMEKDVSKTSET